MSMRITNRMMVDLAVSRMNTRLSGFERSQRSLATGRRIHVPSDDVARMDRSLNLRSALAANAQAQRNAQDGIMWTGLADTRIQTLVGQMQRVRELVILAGNGAQGDTALTAIAEEIAAVRESFVQIANARHRGKPLFSGFSNGDAVTKVGATWTYTGDDGEITRRVSETDTVTVNVTGDRLFGFASGDDVFTMLESIEASLRAGDVSGLTPAIEGVDRAFGRLTDGLARLGAAHNRIEQAMSRGAMDEVGLRTTLSETEDTDMAEAIMELQIQEVAYQAAQAALGRSLQPSLASFLR